MTIDLLGLSETENEDEELVPEILPVDARLSFRGSATVLAGMLQSANDVTPAKEIIPNNGYVLLAGHEQTTQRSSYVEVTATDGERTITLIKSNFSVKLSGSALIPGKRVLDILKLIGGEDIRVDVLGTSMTIRSGRAVWTVSTPPTEYTLPEFSNIHNIDLHTVSRDALLAGLERVYPAISKVVARQSLMQVQISQGKLTACDGVRAHKVTVEGLSTVIDTTLPLKFVESAIKSLRATSAQDVEIGSSASTVALHFGDNILMSQRLNFKYPNVDHLMLGPAMMNDEELVFDKEDLMQSIKRVRINSDPEYFALYLSLRKSSGSWTLTVRARDKEGNSSQETLGVEYSGSSNSRDIVVNHKQFLEFLTCSHNKDVTLKLGESTKTKQAPIFVSEDGFMGSLMVMSPNFLK